MHKTTAVLIALAGMTPAARAVEVYRCVADGGITHYQEQPCHGVSMQVHVEPTGVGGLRDSEVSAYLDAVERDIRRIGPHPSRQLETVNGHLTILRKIVD